MNKSLKSSRTRSGRLGKTDSMSTLGTVTDRIAERLGQVLSAFAVIATKITSSIILKIEKFTAVLPNARAKCLITYQFVSQFASQNCSVGSQDLKCLCKHSYKEHHPVTRKCQRAGCKNCATSFTSKHGCACP